MTKTRLYELIKKLLQLKEIEIYTGYGPKHPDTPNIELLEITESYVRTFAFLKKDQGYIDFIEMFSGMYIYNRGLDTSINVFGFTDVSFDIWRVDDSFLVLGESNIIEDGFLVFCDATFRYQESTGLDTEKKFLGTAFAYDATGERQEGIYRAKNTPEYQPTQWDWYCSDFIKLVETIFTSKANLPL